MIMRNRFGGALTITSLALAIGSAAVAQDNRGFACPASLTVLDQPQIPGGWSGAGGKLEHLFKTAKIYNGAAGGKEFDLEPDDQKKAGKTLVLSWNLDAYRDVNLFVRCFYHDTSATLHADLPPPLKKCSVTLEFNSANEIVGKSRMACQ
jgi:hypothetical protein